MVDACKLVVNCTPVGSYPFTEDEVLFPYEHLSEEHLVIDLIYNPSKTVFLKKSEDNGAQILNGSSMLSEQAMKSWQIWSQKD
jgi:shikimate dehydrogenase